MLNLLLMKTVTGVKRRRFCWEKIPAKFSIFLCENMFSTQWKKAEGTLWRLAWWRYVRYMHSMPSQVAIKHIHLVLFSMRNSDDFVVCLKLFLGGEKNEIWNANLSICSNKRTAGLMAISNVDNVYIKNTQPWLIHERHPLFWQVLLSYHCCLSGF